jgi:arginine utilization protein RocB
MREMKMVMMTPPFTWTVLQHPCIILFFNALFYTNSQLATASPLDIRIVRHNTTTLHHNSNTLTLYFRGVRSSKEAAR